MSINTATSQHQAAATRKRRRNPNMVVRVAGLPYEAVASLRSESLRKMFAAERDAEERAARSAQTLSALAYEAIGGLDDPQLRRQLIRLRRDVHNGRPTGPIDGIPDPIRSVADEYRTAHRNRAHAQLQTDLAVREAVRHSRESLRSTAGVQDLRLGMQLSSVDIDVHVDRYLSAPAQDNKRTRDIESSLVEYLYRTAAKTSPFGRLTTVMPAEFTTDAEHGAAIETIGAGGLKRSRAVISLTVLSRLVSAVVESDDIWPTLSVALVRGADVHSADTVSYWRHSVRRGDDTGAVVLDNVREARFLIPRGEVTAAAMEELTSPRRVAEAAKSIADAHGWSRAEVVEHLRALATLGVLTVPDLAIDVHARRPLAAFREAIQRIEAAPATRLAESLVEVERRVDEFADAALVRRRELLTQMRSILNEALRQLGADAIGLPKTLVFEDATVVGASIVADAGWWSRQDRDLAAVARLIPAFDANGIRRSAMAGYFERRFGGGATAPDVLAFVHDFELDFGGNLDQRLRRHRRFENDQQKHFDNWFRQPEITAVDSARLRLRDAVRERAADSEPIDLSETLGERYLESVPDSTLPVDGWTFFAQPSDDRLVVNRVHAGVGLTQSRFLGLLPELVGRMRNELGVLAPDGVVLAELVGGVDTTNLNLHAATLPFEIVCPGQESTRPVDERIPLDDLYVEHVAEQGRVRLMSRRLGKEVVPVYQGFLVPMALPDLQRTLLTFGPAGPVSLDLWDGVSPDPEHIVMRPRVDWGTVTLNRRSWVVPAAEWPLERRVRDSVERMRAWQRFCDTASLPDRVFVAMPGQSKPCFVDRWAVRSVDMLAALSDGISGSIIVTEADPDPAGLPRDRSGERWVAEVTVEVNGTKETW